MVRRAYSYWWIIFFITDRDNVYSIQAQPGPKKVEIKATRETGQKDAVMNTVVRESYIPAKYNSATTLNAEIAAGNNTFDYELKE